MCNVNFKINKREINLFFKKLLSQQLKIRVKKHFKIQFCYETNFFPQRFIYHWIGLDKRNIFVKKIAKIMPFLKVFQSKQRFFDGFMDLPESKKTFFQNVCIFHDQGARTEIFFTNLEFRAKNRLFFPQWFVRKGWEKFNNLKYVNSSTLDNIKISYQCY